MSIIWFDVTSLLIWQRPAVGVIRTEAECARYALRNIDNLKIKFCRFDWDSGYLSVTAQEVNDAIKRIDSYREVGSLSSIQSHLPTTSKLSRLKRHIRSFIYMLPARVRMPLLRYLSGKRETVYATVKSLREFRQALRALRKTQRQAPRISMPVVSDVENGLFARGDVYVSLGLDWDQKSQAYIYEAKLRDGFKTLSYCYDLIPVKYPHLCVGDVSATFARYFADMAWHSDEIICISECSKRDLLAILNELGAPIPKTSVILLGSDLPKQLNVDVSKNIKTSTGDKFILFVSTIERRKNHETLYRAYTRLIDQGEKDLPRLIFVGMAGWGVADFIADLKLDPRVRDMIHVLTNVSDADLMWLYKHAMFTVFPSLYEGWGLAVAESLANGKFCLATKTGSVPEVGGDLVEYLDPWDVPQWAERLKWYFDHPEELRKAEERIKAQYIAPTWENTAEIVFSKAKFLQKNYM